MRFMKPFFCCQSKENEEVKGENFWFRQRKIEAWQEAVGTIRAAALITIQEGLITKIELFYDTRFLEKK